MKKEEIYEAFQRIRPDEQARERMLSHILSTAELERVEPLPRRRRGTRWVVLLAAALGAVIGLTVAAAAYGTSFFGLWNVEMGQTELTIPTAEDDGAINYHVEERNIISYQGLAGSPEYLANAEWLAFLETYDQDGSLLAAVGNGPTGLSEDYEAYICYTQEMADKLDEICERYGLRLLGPSTVEENVQMIFAQTGVGGLFNTGTRQAVNEGFSGYWYEDGTFAFDGTVTLMERPAERQIVDYQFSRAMKGSFNSVALYISNIEDYEQWFYTTQSGVQVLLASDHSSKALVMANLEQSFVVINVLGDWSGGSFHMTNQDVEDFAEAFDFAAIP